MPFGESLVEVVHSLLNNPRVGVKELGAVPLYGGVQTKMAYYGSKIGQPSVACIKNVNTVEDWCCGLSANALN
jgi:hypothetical protein